MVLSKLTIRIRPAKLSKTKPKKAFTSPVVAQWYFFSIRKPRLAPKLLYTANTVKLTLVSNLRKTVKESNGYKRQMSKEWTGLVPLCWEFVLTCTSLLPYNGVTLPVYDGGWNHIHKYKLSQVATACVAKSIRVLSDLESKM